MTLAAGTHARALRDPRAARRGRDGRGLQGAGHAARADGRGQGAAAAPRRRRRRRASASSARRRRSRSSRIRTSARSTTSGARARPSTSSWSYLEGETLADRLAKGALPLEQTLRYGVEIADALDKAHRQGIVHRDLKPGNVMLTKSGVKLLDFGLAKAMAPAAPQGEPDVAADAAGPDAGRDDPRDVPVHGAGAARGQGGRRADGHLRVRRGALRDGDGAEGVLGSEPGLADLARSCSDEPPPISAVAADDRRRRWTASSRRASRRIPRTAGRRAHDVELQLQWIAEGGSQAGLPAPVVARRKSRERLAWVLAAARLAPPRSVWRAFVLDAPARAAADGPDVDPCLPRNRPFSPTAARWFCPRTAAPRVRRADRGGQEPALGSPPERALGPAACRHGGAPPIPSGLPTAASSDSSRKASSRRSTPPAGPPQTLCDASTTGRGGTWNREGVIVFAPGPREPLSSVSAAGRRARASRRLSMRPDASSASDSRSSCPTAGTFSTSSQAVPSAGQKESDAIYAGSLDSKERRPLVHVRSNAVFAPLRPGLSKGHLLYARDRTVVAQPFDAEDLRFTGERGSRRGVGRLLLQLRVRVFHGFRQRALRLPVGRGGRPLAARLVRPDGQAARNRRRAGGLLSGAPLPRRPAGGRVHRRSADRPAGHLDHRSSAPHFDSSDLRTDRQYQPGLVGGRQPRGVLLEPPGRERPLHEVVLRNRKR